MRIIIILIVLTLGVLLGCVTEGDKIYNSYNYFPEDTTGNGDTTSTHSVLIASPERNAILEVWQNWIPNPNTNPYYQDCNWGYQMDTVFNANVTTVDVGPIAEARVYLRTSPNGIFYDYSVVYHPGSDSFSIRIFNLNSSFTYNEWEELDCAFWVKLTTEDSLNYVSPTVPFRVVPRIHYDMATIPASPIADTLFESSNQQRLTVSWCRISPNIDSFHVAMRMDITGEMRVLAYPGGMAVNTYFNDYLPLTAYSVWITALNEYGESPPSDTMHVTTGEPLSPQELHAVIYAEPRIELRWYNQSYPDSLVIARRDSTSDWATLQVLACGSGYCPSSCSDTTAQHNTVYYYRLGMQFENGLWWSPDSVGVWLP